jgi:GTPase SAR1 family protein
MLSPSPAHSEPSGLSIAMRPPAPRPFPVLRRSRGRNSKSLKILIAGDWRTESPHLVGQYGGVDVNLWFIPAEGLTNPAMSRSYYAGAVGALIVFDFSKPASLATAKRWKKDIDSRVLTNKRDAIPCILLGNKVHLCKADEWKRTDEDMDLFVTENGFVNFLRMKELNAVNVARAAEALVGHLRANSSETQRERAQTGERQRARNAGCKLL